MSITPPNPIKASPGNFDTHGPAGSTRSARMNALNAAIVMTLMVPPANMSSISIQQQPMQ